jgi:hypothetical protein
MGYSSELTTGYSSELENCNTKTVRSTKKYTNFTIETEMKRSANSSKFRSCKVFCWFSCFQDMEISLYTTTSKEAGGKFSV